MKIHNFSSGPSILPDYVLRKASEAVVNFNDSGLSLLEISHRTDSFIQILEEARELVIELLGLKNKGYKALFLQGGASLEFVRVAYNLMNNHKKAGYIDTGRWAANAMNEARFFGEVVTVASSKDKDYAFIPKNYSVPSNLDYLHLTSNNTIYGTQFQNFPKLDIPLVCDMSSDIFSRVLDFEKFDLIYACAQKNVGTSGVNLIVIKEELLNRTSTVLPNIMNYKMHIEKESMYNTPAVFSIYVSYLTLQWIKQQGGISAMEERSKARSELIYNEIDRNSMFYGTAAKEDRSLMNAVFFLHNQKLSDYFDSLCKEAGISGLKGHRTVGGYRASMYNALPLESVSILVEVMRKFQEIYND